MRHPPSAAEFARQLGTRFEIASDEAASLSLELVEASRLAAPAGYEAFSLVFRGPADVRLEQATHRFKHAELGELDLFIVPIRRAQDGLYYEAVFNLLRPEAAS
jgi:hypothetical protein